MTSNSLSSSSKTLKFKKSIIGTVKEPISTKELLIRLQSLSNELSAVNQDNVQLDSFKRIQKNLVNKKLLLHSNVGIQSYVCCSISDILRINAPNAPFTTSELTQIFRAFFRQFKKLCDEENQYYYQQCYLLKRLAEVRSIILITDLPDAEDLMISIFETFYNMTKIGFPRNLEPLVSDILSELISESDEIPTSILKLILDKFYSDSGDALSMPTGNNSGISNPGIIFSIQICDSNLDRMSRLVAQYFSESLYENSSKIERSKDDKKSLSRAEQTQYNNSLQSLRKIHKLIIQIWKYIPELLSSVMGLLDDEFNADDENIRILATETIGKMLGSSNISTGTFTSKVNFFVSHKDTWSNFLKKTTDISSAVRNKWIEQLPNIIKTQALSTSDVCASLSKCLYKCLLDTDEKVRLSACKGIREIPFELFTSKTCNKEIITTLFHLTREKSSDIRKITINILGGVYESYTKTVINGQAIDFGNRGELESSELEDLFKLIPNQILSLIYINDKNINSEVDFCIVENFLPISESNSKIRVNRLLRFYSVLDQKAKSSFIAIHKRQSQISKVLQTFMETAAKLNNQNHIIEEKENSEVHLLNSGKTATNTNNYSLLGRMDKIIKWICTSFPDGLNSFACFERFFKLNNSRFFYLIKTCISPESDYNTVRNSLKELLNKLNDSKNIALADVSSHISTSDMVINFKLLLLRASVLAYNRSNIAELINYSKNPNHEWNSTANEILENISTSIPDVLKFHLDELTRLIIEHKEIKIPQSQNLKTIYHFIKKYRELYPKDINFSESLKNIAINDSPLESKYAIKILGLGEKNKLYCSSVVNSVYPLSLNEANFSTHLSALAEIYLLDPMVLEDKSSDLTALLIKEIFLKNRSIDKTFVDQEDGWIEDEVLDIDYRKHSTLCEKLLAMRFMVNKLRALVNGRKIRSTEEKNNFFKQSQPILKLLVSFIGNGGEILSKESSSWPTPELYKSKLKLAAGNFILKLSKIPDFNELISPTTIRRLTFLLTDLNYNVRYNFLTKLEKNLINDEISERFLSVIFFCALETNKELKSNSSIWISSYHKRQMAKNSTKVEKTLVRIIHILAHHEQFISLSGEDKQDEQLQAFTYIMKFIIFFISLTSTSDNISMLYYFASRVKQYRDSTLDSRNYESEILSKEALNLYRVAELTQIVIKEYSDLKNWPMQTWPGKLKLPSDLFVPMANAKEVQNVITRVFIPEEIQIELYKAIKKKFSKTSKRKSEDRQTSLIQKKARANQARMTKKLAMSNRKEISNHTVTHEPSRKSSRIVKQINYMEEKLSDEEESDKSDDFE